MKLFIGIIFLFLLLSYVSSRGINVFVKITLLLFLTSLAVMTYTVLWAEPPTRQTDIIWIELAPWKHIILIICMLFGMMSNYFFEFLLVRIRAKESKRKVQPPKFVWEKFVLPFIMSGLVFGYFWGLYNKEPISLTVVLVSYQNGFFWQAIVGIVTKR